MMRGISSLIMCILAIFVLGCSVKVFTGIADLDEHFFDFKSKNRWYIEAVALGMIVIWFSSAVFAEMPAVVNKTYTEISGEVISCKMKDTQEDFEDGGIVDKYNLVLKDSISGQEYNYSGVCTKDKKISPGAEVTIYVFDAYVKHDIMSGNAASAKEDFESRFVTSRTEKVFFLILCALQIVGWIGIIVCQYKKRKPKGNGKKWFGAAIGCAIIYLTLMTTAIGSTGNGNIRQISLRLIYVCFFICDSVYICMSNESKYAELKEKLLACEGLPEENESEENKSEENKQCANIGESIRFDEEIQVVGEVRLRQMNDTNSQKYYNYKYNKRKKDAWEVCALLFLLCIMAAILTAVFIEGDEYALVVWLAVGAAAGLSVILPAAWMKRFRRKNSWYEKAKEVFCEYGITAAQYKKEIKLICADGTPYIYRMKYDDDMKIKDGECAIIIYIPGTDQVFMEQQKTLEKLLEQGGLR